MGPGSYVTSTASYYNQPKRTINPRLLLLIGLVVAAITLIIVIVSLSGRASITTESQHLKAQLSGIDTLTTNASGQLSDGNIKKINAETALIADGVRADLAGILPKKIDKKIATAESDATSTQKLSDAALAGNYDDTYKTVLKQKLETITAQLSAIYAKTKSPSLRATLNQNYTDFEALLTNLNKLT